MYPCEYIENGRKIHFPALMLFWISTGAIGPQTFHEISGPMDPVASGEVIPYDPNLPVYLLSFDSVLFLCVSLVYVGGLAGKGCGWGRIFRAGH